MVVERTAPDAARIAWTRPLDLTNVTGYRVYYSPDGADISVEQWSYVETVGLERTAYVLGLNPSSKYSVAVRAKFDGKSFGSFSEIATSHAVIMPGWLSRF